MLLILIGSAIQHLIMKRYAVSKEKSFEAKLHNIRITAIAAIPLYIAYSLITAGDMSTKLPVAIITGVLLSLFNMWIAIGDAKKLHENEQLLEKDLSRISIDESTSNFHFNPASLRNTIEEETTSEFDPDDQTEVFVSSRSSGTKYHYSADCITYCKATSRGAARSARLRPCKLCGAGDPFLPKDSIDKQ